MSANKKNRFPRAALLKFILVIFFIEAVIMLLTPLLITLPYAWMEALLDAGILTIISTPVFYLWILKPLNFERTYAEQTGGMLKSIFAVFLPLFILFNIITITIYKSEIKADIDEIANKETDRMNLHFNSVVKDFKSVVFDLIYLAETRKLTDMFKKGKIKNKDKISEKFHTIVATKKIYDQIRYIDNTGKEIIRVNFSAGNSYIVPEAKLQSKKNRYYFKETLPLKSGEIYISKFDLNIEKGGIELPFKPVIRFGSPVVDKDGKKHGIIVINYLAGELLENLKRETSDITVNNMFLNSKGFWLKGLKPEDEWGFMFKDRTNRTFGNAFPDEWQKILETDSGQFRTTKGLFTFRTIYPVDTISSLIEKNEDLKKTLGHDNRNQQLWKIVSYITKDTLNEKNHDFTDRLILLYIIISLLLLMGSYLLASSWKARSDTVSLLEQSEEQYRLMHTISFDGIILANSKGTIIDMNPKAEYLFGYEEGELIGMNVSALVPKEFREQHLKRINNVNAIGQSKIMGRVSELKGLKKCGDLFPCELVVNSFELKGEFHFTATINDITKRKKNEESLRFAKDEADRANIAKSEFLANMSHEIRTPLNGVLGMAELAMEQELTPTTRDLLTTLSSEAKSLLDIINDVLDFSKIEAGKMHFESVTFDLQTLMNTISKSMSMQAMQKGLDFILFLSPRIPVKLKGDPQHLKQILKNLIGNSIKFTSDGEILVQAVILEDLNNKVIIHFSIKDSGIGIPKEKRKHIFESFTQADGSTSRKYGGTGLGTTISKKLVELHSGKIGLESEVDFGSTFWFDLPFFKATEKTINLPRIKAKNSIKPSVLILDKNPAERYIMHQYLISFECHPTEAVNVEEALTILKESASSNHPISLILLDPHIENIDVLNSLTGIRKTNAHDHTLVMALLPAKKDNENYQDKNLITYLSKPILMHELHKAIQTFFNPATETGILSDSIKKIKSPAAKPTIKNIRILLVEDYPINQKLVTIHLKKEGYTVDLAENGLQAVERFKSLKYDLVFMDIQMPVMDGYEATKMIRLHESKSSEPITPTPIVAMTAHALNEHKDSCIKAGMDDYISKPITKETLLAILKKWTAHKNTAKQGSKNIQIPKENKKNYVKEDNPINILQALKEFENDRELLAEVIEEFILHVKGQVPKLYKALRDNDLVTLKSEAHSIKGGAANLTASKLSKVALKLENSGKSGTLDEGEDLVKTLEKELISLEGHCKKHLF